LPCWQFYLPEGRNGDRGTSALELNLLGKEDTVGEKEMKEKGRIAHTF
jgi:hypothetical protein